MSSINEAGRTRPSSGATSETSLDDAKGRVKEKDRFGGLQKRKGALDKTAHASRALNKEQTKVGQSSAQNQKRLGDRALDTYQKDRAADKAQAQRQKTTAQPQAAKATAQQPPLKPAHNATMNRPQAQAQAQPAAQQPPAKPARSAAATQPQQQTTPQAAAQQPPAKPVRSAASMRRPAGGAQQARAQEAGKPRTLPRNITSVPTPAPRTSVAPVAAPRTLTRATAANTATVAGYDVLTNAATGRDAVIRQKSTSSHETIGRTPRPALRSPDQEKFLAKGGGFNPANTLGRARSAGVAFPGGGAGDRPVLAARSANASLPAPPRMGVGARFLNTLKNIFTFGAYGRVMAARAHSGRVGITLAEDSLIFASNTHKHIRHSIADLGDSQLSAKEQDTYDAARGVIREALKVTGENVLRDDEYHPEVMAKVALALAEIDKIVYAHTGVAYEAPADERSRLPEFPADSTAVSSFPQDRIYETVAEAQAGGQADQAGAGTGRDAGGTGNV